MLPTSAFATGHAQASAIVAKGSRRLRWLLAYTHEPPPYGSPSTARSIPRIRKARRQ